MFFSRDSSNNFFPGSRDGFASDPLHDYVSSVLVEKEPKTFGIGSEVLFATNLIVAASVR
jgi:hypothetical protein